MPKFILIDHSLDGLGGHHYEYAVHVSHAAQRMGYEIVLATHRRFSDGGSLPKDWAIWPLFRHGIYSKYAVGGGSGQKQPVLPDNSSARPQPHNRDARPGPATFVATLRRLHEDWDRQRHLNQFARACTTLFGRVLLEKDDVVLVATLSDFDFQGLVRFLQHEPKTRIVPWHLQFHFGIFEGRQPEYADQPDRLQAACRPFRRALAQIPHHRVRFYCTTPQMAEQYNRLGVAEFHELPYPVNPSYGASARPERLEGPLQVSCAGVMRKEKGRSHLRQLVEQLWESHLATGQIEFHIQADKRRFGEFLPRDNVGRLRRPSRTATDTAAPLVRVAHPLGLEAYARWIGSSDIGLFLYDGRSYYARCSGILTEMLAAGIPVIVPAGCWLAEQIAEPIFDHLDCLGRVVPAIACWQADRATWQRSPAGGTLEFGPASHRATGTVPIPPGMSDLVVRFQWVEPNESGTYIRLQAEQFNTDGDRMDRFDAILGQRHGGQVHAALFHLGPLARSVRLTWENAFHHAPIRVASVEFVFMAAGHGATAHYPAGAVGLIAADIGQVRPLLEEMVEHYDHYRSSAAAFSRRWIEQHSPERTLRTLLAPAGTCRLTG